MVFEVLMRGFSIFLNFYDICFKLLFNLFSFDIHFLLFFHKSTKKYAYEYEKLLYIYISHIQDAKKVKFIIIILDIKYKMNLYIC